MSKLEAFFHRPIRPVADFLSAFILGGIAFGLIVALVTVGCLLFTGKSGLIGKPDVAVRHVAIEMGVKQ